jgi:hypothetical protein
VYVGSNEVSLVREMIRDGTPKLPTKGVLETDGLVSILARRHGANCATAGVLRFIFLNRKELNPRVRLLKLDKVSGT